MTELEKLLESYKTLTEEEKCKMLIYVETLKKQRTQELSEFPHHKE